MIVVALYQLREQVFYNALTVRCVHVSVLVRFELMEWLPRKVVSLREPLAYYLITTISIILRRLVLYKE